MPSSWPSRLGADRSATFANSRAAACRFRRHGEIRTSPEIYDTRPEAERALWKIASDGRTECTHDRRFYAPLLATFTRLRWGEAAALRRCDLDVEAAMVRVRTAYMERSTGEMLLGPHKSKAGRRIVGILDAIIPALRDQLSVCRRPARRARVSRRHGRVTTAGQLQQDVPGPGG